MVCGDSAVVRPIGGAEEAVTADSLIIAETSMADTMVAEGLAEAGLAHHKVGDNVAPRTAVMAIYEGRKLAMGI